MSTTTSKIDSPGFFKLWWMAARPRTLTASLVPIAVGSALAHALDHFQPLAAAMALLGALWIQIGTNYANDLFDHQKGADDERLGPTRVTSSGLVTPRQIAAATAVAFVLAFVCGLYLVAIAGWPILLVGLISIACGIAYTGGPFPLAYNALGDVFVFLFFGVVATVGTFYVQSLTLHPLAFWASLPVGALGTALLIVNNLRDIQSDARHDKITTAVLLGPDRTRWFYLSMLVVAFSTPVALWLTGQASATVLLMTLALPLAVRMWQELGRREGAELNAVLAGTAKLQLVSGLLFALGIAL